MKQENTMNDGMKTVVVAGKDFEAMEMDGKVYVDAGEGLVEYVPKSCSVMVGRRMVEFKVGECYANYFGVAQVRDIKGDKMKVRYVSAEGHRVSAGYEAEYPVKAQAEAILDEEKKQNKEMLLARVEVVRGSNNMFLAGWLAANGVLEAKMPEAVHERFRGDYMFLAGESPDMAHVRDGGKNSWMTYGMEVRFAMPSEALMDQMKFPDGVKLLVFDNHGEMWSNPFVKGLVKLGLRMGRNDRRVETIAACLSPEDRKAFLEGAEVGDRMKKAA